MSDLITWTPSMSVGVSVLDEDHKRIMALINDLHKAIKEGEGKDALGDIFHGLHVYINLHFETEEAILKQASYTGTHDQELAHIKMKERTQEIRRQFRDDPSAVHPTELLVFLRDWWVDHIMNSDMKYADHLRAKGVR